MKKSMVSLLILCGVLSASCVSNQDNTVTCSDTNLMWQDNAEIGIIRNNWQGAINYCESLALANHTDWRLPNITELKSITDRITEVNPSLQVGFTQRSANWFWSSTQSLSDNSITLAVDFTDGNDRLRAKSGNYSVRCVR